MGRASAARLRPPAWLIAAVFALISFGVVVPAAAETVLVESGSATIYLANESDPGALVEAEWFEQGFDDTPWDSGTFGIGYEDVSPPAGAHDLITTIVPSGARSVYTRTVFTIADVDDVHSLSLGFDFDDGVVAWINGVEVYRSSNLVGEALLWDTIASEHESSNGTEPDYEPLRDISVLALPELQDGENVLAIGLWNNVSPSDDLVLVPRLSINKVLVRGPYLQQGTSDGVIVRWRTRPDTDSRVLYGTDPANLDQEVTDATLVNDHELTLSSLAPNTRYYYAVGTTTGILAGGDPDHFVVTPPAAGTPKPTRIWFLSDSGEGNLAAERVRDAYAAFTGTRHTDLWLMAGDNAMDHGTDLDYQYRLFDVFPEMLRKSVVWPAIGNHDLFDAVNQSWPYYDNFTLPGFAQAGGTPSGTEAYYSFDYANIHFVVLDSNDSQNAPGSAMHTWLQVDLLTTQQEWIVAYWHHPPYSKGSHDSDDPADSGGRLRAMRENIVPVLEDFGVDLVLSGHSHDYERSHLIDGHYGDSTTWDPVTMLLDGSGGAAPYYSKDVRGSVPYSGGGDGIVYTVAGSSSGIASGASQTFGGTQPDHPAMYTSLWERGSVILDVNGNRLDATFLNDLGAVLDNYTIIKGDPPVPPVAEFSGSPLMAMPSTPVDFTDESIHRPTVWEWDFDNDLVIDSVQPMPSHVYGSSGLYTVSLNVENSAGGDQEAKTGYVCVTGGVPGPITGLTAEPGDRFVWEVEPNATSYDVVKGDLNALVTGGSLETSQLGCLLTTGTPEVLDPTTPGAAQSFYYLARGNNCVPETGTFDNPGQGSSRDPALQIGGACPCPAGDDADGDGYCDDFDNCPDVASLDLDDADQDGLGTPCDDCPNDPLNDADADEVCGDVDNCPNDANTDQTDTDGDLIGDSCDPDDDNDGVADGDDPSPLDPDVCGDTDGDSCDDCSIGTDDFGTQSDSLPGNDGPDADGDGQCDAGDTCFDSDGDGLGDGTVGNVGCVDPTTDSNDGDPSICADTDGDSCDDCSVTSWDPANDGTDTDSDGFCDDGDNCDTVAGPQDDLDGDGIGDVCDPCTDTDDDGFGNPGFPNLCNLDNCPNIANPGQADADDDGDGDICDFCPLDPDNDADQDFICADEDNCPFVNNPDQLDNDLDMLGDACDPDDDNDGVLDEADSHPFDRFRCGDWDTDNCDDCSSGTWDQANDGPDLDGDGLCDEGDNDDDGDGVVDWLDWAPRNEFLCRDMDGDSCDDCSSGSDDPADDGPDGDGDGICDAGDGCPADPDKDDPGACGCGVPDTDSDGDGVADCVDICPGGDDNVDGDSDGTPDFCDGCPGDGSKTDPGVCGCGTPDDDSDGDGVADCIDICPGGDDGLDADADGVPDFCDICPGGDDNVDGDSDGTPDFCDGCPGDGNKTDPGVCGCGTPDDDSDGDGVADCNDICPGGDDSLDADADGVPDFCDVCPGGDDGVDTDADGVPDFCDICAGGDDSVDTDADGVPDFCDVCAGGDDSVDTDADGVPDFCDICPGGDDSVDTDADGVPDFCDICPGGDDGVDTDADGVPDFCDVCAGGDDSIDTDADGVPDFCDICPGGDDSDDLDADGVPDFCDICAGGDDGVDTDADGVPDFCDICPGGDDNVDGDSDGTPDFCDGCPGDGNKTDPGTCGCGVADTDTDGDGVADCVDICPGGDDTLDADADGVPDFCDVCPGGDDGVDTDADGVPDFCDVCPGGDDSVDTDADGVPDFCDICPGGDDSVDTDADGVPDFCDICPGGDDGVDTDADGVPDFCDVCPGGDDSVDTDADGVPDFCDICPGGDDSIDTDADGVPDFCDICAGGDDSVDTDADGVPDFCDICPGGDDNVDGDSDGTPDFCDGCPGDGNKTDPGTCGCGVADTDTDGDGVADCVDICPGGDDTLDADADGVPDFCDICPGGDDGVDTDADGVPDFCDVCPGGDDGVDTDADGVPDFCDVCPGGDDTLDADADGVPDFCDICPGGDDSVDTDADGVPDFCDVCPGGDDSIDTDADGVPDFCDVCAGGDDNVDTDADGVPDFCDICPGGDDSDDLDADGVPDFCDICPGGDDGIDTDADGVPDFCDVCAGGDDNVDTDADGVPDFCDICPGGDDSVDTDADGVPDFCDVCPGGDDSVDADADGVPDFCDVCPGGDDSVDADADGVPDFCDICPGGDDNIDTDADGVPDFCDICPGGDDNVDADSDGVPDFCDGCPTDPDKVDPGVCGCGVPDTNFDWDLWPDCIDDDDDGDGVDDVDEAGQGTDPLDPDSDDDGYSDGWNDPDGPGPIEPGDNCPATANPGQEDADGDEVGDVCDNCPLVSNASQADTDGDGIGDACEFVLVSNEFHISITELTNDEYVVFLNAVAGSDPNGLYNPSMQGDPRGGIQRSGPIGSHSYSAKTDMGRKPVNFVSWLDAARYVNWLQNGRPEGAQGIGTTETGSYDLTISLPGSNAIRAAGTDWFIPYRIEWDVAAYAEPTGGVTWIYPTRSDSAPGLATATTTGDVANPGPEIANYDQGAEWNGQEGNVTTVGSAGPSSMGPWGTFDQGGNVAEWTESGTSDNREIRGGSWDDAAGRLRSGSNRAVPYDSENAEIGFRLAAIATCTDSDGDGVGWPGGPSCAAGLRPDNCPDTPNPQQEDSDGDGIGDACDAGRVNVNP